MWGWTVDNFQLSKTVLRGRTGRGGEPEGRSAAQVACEPTAGVSVRGCLCGCARAQGCVEDTKLSTNKQHSLFACVCARASLCAGACVCDIDYWIKMIDIKKGDEVSRFKAARIFNPLHVVVNKISVDDIDNLKLFKLSEIHTLGHTFRT